MKNRCIGAERSISFFVIKALYNDDLLSLRYGTIRRGTRNGVASKLEELHVMSV